MQPDGMKRLAMLDALAKQRPADLQIWVARLQVLEAEKQMERLDAQLQEVTSGPRSTGPLPSGLAGEILQVMIRQQKWKSAAALAGADGRPGPTAPIWRYRAALLTSGSPAAAIRYLPSPDRADLAATALGVVLSERLKNASAVKRWVARYDALAGRLRTSPRYRVLLSRYNLLIAVATQDAGRMNVGPEGLHQ